MQDLRRRNGLAPARDGVPHGTARAVVEDAPCRDLVEGAKAPFAQAGGVAHATDADTWRRDARRFVHHQYPRSTSTTPVTGSPRSNARILRAICSTVSPGIVSPATCGVIVIPGCDQNGCAGGRGSSRKTSSVALPSLPASI